MYSATPSSSSSSSSSSSLNLETLMGQIYDSRRLLLHSPFRNKAAPGGVPAESPSSGGGNGSQEMYMGDSAFDANVVMILAVLLCALICALGLNSIIRCALRCSSRRASAGADRARNGGPNAAGIKKKALKTFPLVTYSPDLNLPAVASECIICLSDFARGAKLRVLPKCNHAFHAKCIDKWLGAHSTCPTCRQCLLDTCKKIVGCDGPATTPLPQVLLPPVPPAPAAAAVLSPPPPPPPPVAESVVVNIVPLEREGLVGGDVQRC